MQQRMFDKIFSAVLWGFVLFVLPLCAGWWTAYAITKDTSAILAGCLIGAGAGVAANLLFLKKLAAGFYRATGRAVALLLVYTVGIFGFFMGVPVFNLLAGALAAVYMGRQAKVLGLDKKSFLLRLRRAQHLLFAVLLLICAASSLIALSDPYTAANLKGMFALSFLSTHTMISGFILVGGSLLLALQALAVRVLANAAYAR